MLTRFFESMTRLSIRFRWLVLVLSLVIMAGGIYAVTTLNMEMLPRIEFPQTIVVAQWSDAESAEQFLNEVTTPLEEVLVEVEGVVNLESNTSKSFAFLIVRNEFGEDQDRISADIKEAVNSVALPEGVEPPEILNISLSDLPVVVASASSSDLTLTDLKELVTTDLLPRLEQIDEIDQVAISGGQELPDETIELPEIDQEEEPAAETEPEDPGRLPQVIIDGAKSAGLELEYAQDITPELLSGMVGFADADQVMTIFGIFPPDVLRYLPAETLALLPSEYVSQLEPDLLAELDELAAEQGGVGQYTVAEILAMFQPEEVVEEETPDETADAAPEEESISVMEPPVEPVALPDSWIAAAAQMGQELSTTADLTPDVMGAIAGFAPEMLAELEPEMWRAMDPAAVSVVLPIVVEEMDPVLYLHLNAIIVAAEGKVAEPVDLPESWVAAGQAVGFPLATTADINAQAIGLLAANAPELLDDLTDEVILRFSPEVQAALPEEYLTGLDEGLQETIGIVAAWHLAAQDADVEEQEPEPVETPDPARLPDVLIQGASSFGVELEYAYDITSEFMRQIGAFGPQAVQMLQVMTPENLRNMQPEVIALLPEAFLAELEPALREELDELSAEFGGAGQLAVDEAGEEAEPTEESDPDAPLLTGPWIEPGLDGEPSQFQTASDILNNPFIPGAAMFLNFFPDSPQVDDPIAWMAALSPEVIAYLAANEEDFASNLSPVILEMLSPEVLTYLLDNYPESFDAEQANRLRAIASGTLSAFVPEASITRTDGDPSLIISLFKDGDANTVEVAHRVFDELAAVEAENPDISFSLVFEQASFIEESIEGVSREGLLGAIFAVLMILIFLSGRVNGKYRLSWRSTLVVAISIPLSLTIAFLLIRLVPSTLGVWINDLANETGNGFLKFGSRLFPTSVTLNIMTLSGLTVAVGRIVDDSIVVLENSYRYIQRGDDPKMAIIAGTREVAIAIFASTATTIAVFLPLGLTGGLIGSFFLPFALTVTYALGASFFVAITVVPAMAYLLIRKENIPEERETTMQRVYTPWLEWVLRHRGITMAGATFLFAVSLFLVQQLPQSFIPEIGEPTINVTVSLPADTGMSDTDELVKEFEIAAGELSGVEKVQSEVGGAGGFESFFGGGGVSQNLANVAISVEDQDDLAAVTNEVRDEAEAIFGKENAIVSAASQTGFGGFSLIVTSDSIEDIKPIIDNVKAALSVIDLDESGRPDIVNISSSLDQAGVGGNETIIRIDGRPAVSFTGEMETANTLGVLAEAKQVLTELESLPSGAEVTEGFESEQQSQGFSQMITAIIYSIIIVYAIMALTFRSFIHPFTILFSLPFAFTGAAFALWISDSVLGISAMIGLMMLVGIVVTNAIVLLELVQQLRERGQDAYTALVHGGRTRLRPIWMTALATALALTPLALSQEGGALIASELAIVVIGGLLVSTFLTLLIVPVVYSLFDDLGGKLRRKPKVEEAE